MVHRGANRERRAAERVGMLLHVQPIDAPDLDHVGITDLDGVHPIPHGLITDGGIGVAIVAEPNRDTPVGRVIPPATVVEVLPVRGVPLFRVDGFAARDLGPEEFECVDLGVAEQPYY